MPVIGPVVEPVLDFGPTFPPISSDVLASFSSEVLALASYF